MDGADMVAWRHSLLLPGGAKKAFEEDHGGPPVAHSSSDLTSLTLSQFVAASVG